jgi:hypothetical protein
MLTHTSVELTGAGPEQTGVHTRDRMGFLDSLCVEIQNCRQSTLLRFLLTELRYNARLLSRSNY